jgi:arylsulfatase A-like enzyme
MLLLHGTDVESGSLDTRSILDIFPTVLRYLDTPVPTDVDGDAIEEPFVGGLPDLETREPIESGTATDAKQSEELEQRLSDLGYLE